MLTTVELERVFIWVSLMLRLFTSPCCCYCRWRGT